MFYKLIINIKKEKNDKCNQYVDSTHNSPNVEYEYLRKVNLSEEFMLSKNVLKNK